VSRFIHPSAQIAPNVIIGKNVYVGPYCILGFPGFQLRTTTELEHLIDGESGQIIIGDNTKIFGHTVICQNTVIGEECRIDYHSFIGEDTQIGNQVVVEYGARIYDSVVIGDKCIVSGFIANGCHVMCNSIIQGDLIHKFKEVNRLMSEPSPKVESNAFVGRKAVVIGSVIIGEGSYIGAGSIVTRSTRKNMLYYGNPAREVGKAPIIYID
jgi:acetyltransferase-like isoleucine patch superfamily enzyme